MPAQDSVGDGCRLARRKTASGMAAAWLAAAPHQDQESELAEGSK